eukprot:jgi/Mesen1/2761/ME000017S02126
MGSTAVPNSEGAEASRPGSSVDSVARQEAAAEGYETVFVKDNVCVHPSQAVNERIAGRLQLIKQGPSLFMTWIPYNNAGVADDKGKALSQRAADRDRYLYTIRAVSVAEMRSIRRHTPALGWHYIIIVLTNGLAFAPLYFHSGGVKEYLATLKMHAVLVRSADDANVYLVNDIQDPLQKSLHSLDMAEAVAGPVAPSPAPVEEEEKEAQEEQQKDDEKVQVVAVRREALSVQQQLLERFSMVTKAVRDTGAHLLLGVSDAAGSDGLLGGRDALQRMPHPRPARLPPHSQGGPPHLSSSVPLPLQAHARASERPLASSESELASGKASADTAAGTGVGAFELVDANMQMESQALVYARARPPPLSAEEWASFEDSEGRVPDPKALRKRVFQGGVAADMRCEVWKFLLGYFPFDSTREQRAKLVAEKKEEYTLLKAQWQSVTPQQERRFAKFRERRSRVDKDVVRTDRAQAFYEGDDNPNVGTLRAILITYSFYNFDLGYCQGMSDLLAPVLYVMRDEADAFWCFVALMERMAPNFHRDQNGMHSQLLALSKLVMLLDAPLHHYLQSVDCLNYFFCFRWVLIHFKREFKYEDVLCLWEVLWSRHLSEHFHLYICVAILKRHRRSIMDEQMEFDTLLKYINELSGHIELESTLRDAEALCRFAGERGVSCMPPPPSSPDHIETYT